MHRIGEIRRRRGMTQEELGRRIGVNNITICRYEKGHIDITLSRLEQIAAALGVPTSHLLLEDTLEAFPSDAPALV